MQAANTGLTAGSVPNNDDYDREVVIINTLRINNIVLLNGGEQVLGFAGATLYALEKKLKAFKKSATFGHWFVEYWCIDRWRCIK